MTSGTANVITTSSDQAHVAYDVIAGTVTVNLVTPRPYGAATVGSVVLTNAGADLRSPDGHYIVTVTPRMAQVSLLAGIEI
jgi:hypothetical protein